MKLNRAHIKNQAQFQARLEAQRNALQGELEQVNEFPSPKSSIPSLFKSHVPANVRSVDDLVVLGNKEFENLDKIDFASFRNNKDLGKKTLDEVRAQVTRFHADRTTKEFNQDVSRVMNARYLQGHGLQVEKHLDSQEMRRLRRYFQKETSTYNVADAVRSMNTNLADGLEDVDQLMSLAERSLYTERGLTTEQFQENFSELNFGDLKKVRDFSDAWSTSQGRKFLSQSKGEDFNEHRNGMAREMLKAHGYKNLESLTLDSVLSLLRDIDSEGPQTQKTIRETVNLHLASGESNYFVLNTKANETILEELGVSAQDLQKLAVSDEELKKKYPSTTAAESRAIRTRVLRDIMRVLPPELRDKSVKRLHRKEANLVNAEAELSKYIGYQIRSLSNKKLRYKKMGAMQRANLSTALTKLPKSLRKELFSGSLQKTKNRLESMIEKQFGVEVHREAGVAPDGNKSAAPHVKDWTVQGLVDLYNALNGMAKDGGSIPETLIGHSTVVYVEGSGETPSMSVGLESQSKDPVGPWNRPGAYAHSSGVSGYYGMCSPDEKGHDTVYFCDDALMGTNSDSALGVTIGESTLIHELGHAIQLGGTPGKDKETRERENQIAMAEWSALSRWTEPENVVADGRMGSFEYYYDPTVQVGKRSEVATSYGASDPCEDFAEFIPFFYKAPDVAMNLSAEKFLYLNQMIGEHYSAEQIEEIASKCNLNAEDIRQAGVSMQRKIELAPAQAKIA